MKKIERKQTRDHITQMLRYQILSGAMRPGDELAQESIAEQLGLSRMPVREALQSLEQEGFLTRLPNRHIQVSKLAPDDVSHIFRVIAAMAAELPWARQQAQRLLWQGGILGEKGEFALLTLDDELRERQVRWPSLWSLLAVTGFLARFPAGPLFAD